jgi:hypothetical protein
MAPFSQSNKFFLGPSQTVHPIQSSFCQLCSLLSNIENCLNFFYEGFKDGREACCGTGKFRGVFSCGGKRLVKEFQLCKNPSQHVFWDSYHLTERLHKQLADQMWSGESNAYNLRDLFQSL